MNAPTLTVTVRLRCWVPYYLYALMLFCRTFGTTLSVARIAIFITRYGVKVSV